MKKGTRRKLNMRANRAKSSRRRAPQHFVSPEGIKSKRKLRKNPPWGAMDQKALRKMVNQVIGTTLINALDIDFVGIMDRAEQEWRDKPITETIQ